MPNQTRLPAAKISSAPQNKLHLLHVVRRYGPVGGMERYVWELTIQLQKLGYQVTVLCERCHAAKPQGITVHELGEIAQRPHWLAALRFNWRAVRWLAANPQPDTLIHSHERISFHDITTFHASPFATVFEKPWWKLISLRVVIQLLLERRELNNARYIVPNSQLVKQQLAHYYPEFARKLTAPVTPGVAAVVQRKSHKAPADGGVIGFVGKEWKRKGLPIAVAAVKQLIRTRPNLKFVVIGPDTNEIQHLFKDWQDGYILNRWGDLADYSQFDVLFHPAKAEPYGMVISEAMAAKLPVVISDACGARVHVTSASGTVLPHSAPIDAWVNALDHQLNRTGQIPKFERSWLEVALEYEKYWRSVMNEKSNPARLPNHEVTELSYR